jgi:hypothetical protein
MKLWMQFLEFFKIFFPSWKFFDDSTLWPKLEYQVNDGNWQEFTQRPKVHAFNILFNPDNLVLLNFQTHIQKMLMNLSYLSEIDLENYSKSVDYQQASHFLEYFLRQGNPQLQNFQFKFKISLASELIVSSESIDSSFL